MAIALVLLAGHSTFLPVGYLHIRRIHLKPLIRMKDNGNQFPSSTGIYFLRRLCPCLIDPKRRSTTCTNSSLYLITSLRVSDTRHSYPYDISDPTDQTVRPLLSASTLSLSDQTGLISCPYELNSILKLLRLLKTHRYPHK